ncbi:hypothetical protein PI95_030920 [Hassallia byssoidea VB512170]|uniref:Uncharacterized protein n=1 Tax=Hassallia byssoidea VB512170 TaxID=1304833 RepID=A0A846HJE2_9CYAN|nr:hypothetical protein [Hassalia byssoidea]NEU76804.1 hypothetical protein [Hassalia byssoidea VB512170]
MRRTRGQGDKGTREIRRQGDKEEFASSSPPSPPSPLSPRQSPQRREPPHSARSPSPLSPHSPYLLSQRQL